MFPPLEIAPPETNGVLPPLVEGVSLLGIGDSFPAGAGPEEVVWLLLDG